MEGHVVLTISSSAKLGEAEVCLIVVVPHEIWQRLQSSIEILSANSFNVVSGGWGGAIATWF